MNRVLMPAEVYQHLKSACLSSRKLSYLKFCKSWIKMDKNFKSYIYIFEVTFSTPDMTTSGLATAMFVYDDCRCQRIIDFC